MRAVWKFPMPLKAGDREVEMPLEAKFLTFAILDCGPAAWFEVEPRGLMETRKFRIFGTGHDIDPDYHYLGTGLQPGKELTYVWHLYELRPGGQINGAIKQS